MKVLVDNLPISPHDCLFHKRESNYWGHTVYVCSFNGEKCALSDKKDCPYLQTLNASFNCLSEKDEYKHDWIGQGLIIIDEETPTNKPGWYMLYRCRHCGERRMEPYENNR